MLTALVAAAAVGALIATPMFALAGAAWELPLSAGMLLTVVTAGLGRQA